MSTVERLLGSFSGHDWAVSVPYALAFALVAAEVAWLARRPGPGRRALLRAAATAGAMGAGALVVGFAYTAALRFLWDGLAPFAPGELVQLWRAYPIPAAVAAFVAWDLSGFVYHWVGHHTGVGWAAHQPHHSGEGYDATLGLRQSWAPFHALLLQPLLALLGFDLGVIVVCAAISNCWQVLIHTSLPVRFPRWFEAAVMTPSSHRHHHGRGAAAVNLGPVLTGWDRLAGSWVPVGAPAPVLYGPGDPAPGNPVAVELAGWRELYRSRADGSRPRLARV